MVVFSKQKTCYPDEPDSTIKRLSKETPATIRSSFSYLYELRLFSELQAAYAIGEVIVRPFDDVVVVVVVCDDLTRLNNNCFVELHKKGKRRMKSSCWCALVAQ